MQGRGIKDDARGFGGLGAKEKGCRADSPAAALVRDAEVLVGRCSNDRGDHTGRDGGHYVVAVDLAPLIAAGRGAEVIGAVVDALTAAPVFGAHVVALLPLFVADILLVVVVVVVVMLGKCHERGAADAEKDE